MNLFACPACGVPAFSHGQKAWLGPLRRVRCRHCGAHVSVAALPSAILLLLASLAFPFGFIGGLWLCRSAGSPALSVAGGLVGSLLLSLLFAVAHTRLVPLVVRER